MQYRVIYHNWLLITFVVIFIVLIIIILISLWEIHGLSKINGRLTKSSFCRYIIIEEYSKSRHAYNNLFQTITNLIETEDMEGLITYKSHILESTQAASHNSITHLGKIKAETVLIPVYQLLTYAKEENIKLNIGVFSIIKKECAFEEELYPVLKECLTVILHMAVDEPPEINMGIRESNQGLYFYFEYTFKSGIQSIPIMPRKFEGKKLRKILSYNAYRKENRFIQELIINYLDTEE